MTQAHDFSIRIREERARLKLGQQAFADLGGVSKASQVGYEAGARAPDLKYLQRLAEGGVDIMYVITGRRNKDAAHDLFDWALHDKILDTVDTWLAEQALVLPFTKKMDLLRLFMSNYANEESVDSQFIAHTLKLVA